MATTIARWRSRLPIIDLVILFASSAVLISIQAEAQAFNSGKQHHLSTSSAFLPPTSTLRTVNKQRYPQIHFASSTTDNAAGNSNKKIVSKNKRGKNKKNIGVTADLSPAATAPSIDSTSVENDADLDSLLTTRSVETELKEDDVKLVDFIEQNVGIQTKKQTSKMSTQQDDEEYTSQSASEDEVQASTAHTNHVTMMMEEQPPPSVTEKKGAPYNVVCTHITADFDTLASAIGLAKLWSLGIYTDQDSLDNNNEGLPTYVVLPRGAHPDVSRFLSLHKHLFPIRSLKSLPGLMDDANTNSRGLQRVGLVDAQRRDRLGPADILLDKASLGVTIVDHHVDAESDIDSKHYIVENVGSVSTMIAERLKRCGVRLTEAEATVLALGIHGDTGSLVYDSTVRWTYCVSVQYHILENLFTRYHLKQLQTAKDASMLGWCMELGASQSAIAEHAKPTMSDEQQRVLTQSLVNLNTTTVHGVTISTVLLR